jgi:hypothetical protein
MSEKLPFFPPSLSQSPWMISSSSKTNLTGFSKFYGPAGPFYIVVIEAIGGAMDEEHGWSRFLALSSRLEDKISLLTSCQTFVVCVGTRGATNTRFSTRVCVQEAFATCIKTGKSPLISCSWSRKSSIWFHFKLELTMHASLLEWLRHSGNRYDATMDALVCVCRMSLPRLHSMKTCIVLV